MRVELGAPTRLERCFGLHRFGPADPTTRIEPGRVSFACHTPDGPAVLDIQARSDTVFEVEGHGPGGPGLEARAEQILGKDDAPETFEPLCSGTRTLVRRVSGLRIVATPAPHALLATLVLQQRVAWKDAAKEFRWIVKRWGSDAPGDFGLRLAPAPKVWTKIPLAELSALGMDRKRAETLKRVAQVANRIDALVGRPFDEVRRKLLSVPGLGPWTVEHLLGLGFGDADALPTGDYDLHHRVASVLAGKARSSDAEMVELMEKYRGHRFRVIRMIEEAGVRLVRFAPRRASPPRPRGGFRRP